MKTKQTTGSATLWGRWWQWEKSTEPLVNKFVPVWLRWLGVIVFTITLPFALISKNQLDKVWDWAAALFKQFVTMITIVAFLSMITPDKVSAAPVHIGQASDDGTVLPNDWLVQDYANSSLSVPSAPESGSYVMAIQTTNIVSWQTNNGIVYVTTAGGDTYPVANLGLCGALIFGGIVIVVATIGGCKIAQCAKRKLNPKTNTPPENLQSSFRMMNLVSGSPMSTPPPTITGNSMGGGHILNLPDGMTVTVTNISDNDADVADATEMEWRDWQGNMVIRQFGFTVSPTNLAVGTKFCYMQSTTNFMDALSWTNEGNFSITGWVSAASIFALYTNAMIVTYDQFGSPFKTNWFQLQPTNNGDYAMNSLGSVGDLPRRSDKPQLFFRAEIK